MARKRQRSPRGVFLPWWMLWGISLIALGMAGLVYYAQYVANYIALPRWLSVVLIVGLGEAAMLPWAMQRWVEKRREPIRLKEWFVVYLIMWVLASVYILFVK